MKLFVFVPHDLCAPYTTAVQLVAAANELHLVDARLIDKLSSNIEELTLVAAYGVVEPVAVILEDSSGIRARLAEIPALDRLAEILRLLHDSRAVRG